MFESQAYLDTSPIIDAANASDAVKSFRISNVKSRDRGEPATPCSSSPSSKKLVTERDYSRLTDAQSIRLLADELKASTEKMAPRPCT